MANGIFAFDRERIKRVAEDLRKLADELESPTSDIVGVAVITPQTPSKYTEDWQLTITRRRTT